MGSGMARQLAAKGFPLTVFNRNAEKSKPFTADARVAGSPREAASSADVIVSMVADDNASRSMWLGDGGALAAVARGAVCIECSTLSVDWVRELAQKVAAVGCGFLDAPVTGSKAQAAAGELNFIVGGEAATLEKARPVLEAMSKTILHVGPTGSGALLKLINNFVCGVEIAALAEAMAMIERAGLNREKAMEVIANGAPGSPLVKAVSGRMTKPDYTPNFMLRLMAKDLKYAMAEGDKLSVELVTAAAALEEFQRGIAGGHGDQDIAAVVEPLRKGG
jgi:3-hydroxyisobutyrate dehydrogenase